MGEAWVWVSPKMLEIRCAGGEISVLICFIRALITLGDKAKSQGYLGVNHSIQRGRISVISEESVSFSQECQNFGLVQ